MKPESVLYARDASGNLNPDWQACIDYARAGGVTSDEEFNRRFERKAVELGYSPARGQN